MKGMSISMLEKKKNKCVRQMVFGGTSSALSLGYMFSSKGTKAEKFAALGVAVVSAPSGFDRVQEYKTIRDEMAERGVEVRHRKRDIVPPAGLSVAANLAALAAKRVAKSVVKSTGFL